MDYAPTFPATLDAVPVLSPAEKAALAHAYKSIAYAQQVRREWLEECHRARTVLHTPSTRVAEFPVAWEASGV
jgi:hypothetical protein